MTHSTGPSTGRPLARHRSAFVAVAVAILAAVAIVVAVITPRDESVASGSVASDPAAGDSAQATTDPQSGAADGFQDPVTRESDAAMSDATATRVQIPAIDIDSALEQLPLDPETGELTPPVDWLSAGWYRDGTVPGDVGPAVIAGHVDSVTAPAVFARLGELVPGDEIIVTLSTGETNVFTVDSQTDAPKDEFPTDLVYGPTPTPQLRLITCDGDFDGATGHYLDNLIVFASLTAA